MPQQPTCLQQKQKHGSSSELNKDRVRNNKQIQTLKIDKDVNKSTLKVLIVDVLNEFHDIGHASTTNMPATKTKMRIFKQIEWRSFSYNKQIQTLKIDKDINKSALKTLIVDILHKIYDFGRTSTTNVVEANEWQDEI